MSDSLFLSSFVSFHGLRGGSVAWGWQFVAEDFVFCEVWWETSELSFRLIYEPDSALSTSTSIKKA